jgi:hypothetical protein
MRHQPSIRESVAILAFWVVCLAICAGALGVAWAERLSFDGWGRAVPGTILEIRRPSRSPYVATFRYTVAAPDGQVRTYSSRRFVTEEVAASIRDGSAISVVYLPDQPNVADIRGNRFALLGDLTWSTIILTPIALFCATLCWLGASEITASLRRGRQLPP